MADKGEGEKSKVGANVCKINSTRLLNSGGRKEEKWMLCIGESVLSLGGETDKRGGELCCLSIVVFLLGPFISQLASRLVLPSLWSLQRDLGHSGRGYSEKVPGQSGWHNGRKYTWETGFHQQHSEHPGTDSGWILCKCLAEIRTFLTFRHICGFLIL